MSYIHTIIEKCLIATFVLCFSFFCVYVPGGWNKVEQAEAGAMIGSTFPQQLVDNFLHAGTNVASSVSAGADTISANLSGLSFIRDNVLNGIAWALAKAIVAQMTSSIVNWVNSGFKGSPAFITDINSFLLDIADKEFGRYLEDLGGPFSFICAPFKLDVRLALSVTYNQARSYGQTPSTCSLTGALANIEKFIDGTQTFVDAGGWENWFSMTTQPEAYTPLGNILAAQAELSARITNAKGEEVKILGFGNGFLSSKVCEKIEGREKCTVSTPGKVIQEALTFQTSTGARSLIQADQINEVISATFGQIAKQAITGAAGLLGLSPGTGYTRSGVPYTQQLAEAAVGIDPDQLMDMITDSLLIDTDYQNLAQTYAPRLRAFAADNTRDAVRRADAQEAADEIPGLLAEITGNIIAFNDLITDLDELSKATSPEEEQAIVQDVYSTYIDLPYLHSEVEVDGKKSYWDSMLR